MDGFFGKETAQLDGFVEGCAETMMITQPVREVSHTVRLPHASITGAYFIGSFDTGRTNVPVILRNRNAKLKRIPSILHQIGKHQEYYIKEETWQI